MRRPSVPVLALSVVALAACSRPAGPSEREAYAPRPAPVREIAVARPPPPVDASPGKAAASSSAESVADFDRPSGCSEIYETNDVCKTVQALVDARTRPINRACASRFNSILPDYSDCSISCEWQRFASRSQDYKDSKDCYAERYGGEAIICSFYDSQHYEEYDASVPYEALQKALTGCLSGWKYEETSTSKVHSDRAFSFSKVVEDGAGKSVMRVQACLSTQRPRDLDEQPMKFVRIEVFAEPLVGTADGGTR